jgi:hypothetical protein
MTSKLFGRSYLSHNLTLKGVILAKRLKQNVFKDVPFGASSVENTSISCRIKKLQPFKVLMSHSKDVNFGGLPSNGVISSLGLISSLHCQQF